MMNDGFLQGFTRLYNIKGGIHAYSVKVDETVPKYQFLHKIRFKKPPSSNWKIMYCKKDLCQENQIALPVTETGSFTPGYLGNSLFMEEGQKQSSSNIYGTLMQKFSQFSPGLETCRTEKAMNMRQHFFKMFNLRDLGDRFDCWCMS